MARRLINSFNSGEWSPLADARTDLEKYGNGCRILENCVPKIYGGAFGRAGMEYMGPVKDHARKACLKEFIFSASTNFVLEFGHLTLRFWSNGQQVLSGGIPLEVVTPYTENDIFSIQMAQVNDVVYLVDGVHPVQRLTRKADDDWELVELAWKFPALGDENITATTLQVSATTGTGVTMTASTGIFNANHVGSFWQLVHRRATAFENLNLTSNGFTTGIKVLGRYDIFTYGTWSGDLYLERQDSAGTWEVIKTYSSRSDRNVQDNGTQEESAVLRLRLANYASHTATPRAVIEIADSRIYGLVKVTGYTSPTVVTVTVVEAVSATTATLTWSEGAWSNHQGHPRTVTMHEQRIIYGGCQRQPLTLWGSVIGDFENFRRTTLEDASYAHILGSTRGNSIVWIASHGELIVGSQGEEWVVSGGEEGASITSVSVNVKRQSGYGSAYVQSLLGNDALIFVQRGRKKLREFVYQFERDGYTAPDMTMLAEHVSGDGFVQLAFATNPDPVVWAVTQDGQLLSMTFERDQSVVGWSRHPTQGTVESVAVVFGQLGEADEVWVVTRRTIIIAEVETQRRYIERIDPRKWLKLEATKEEEEFTRFIYSDSAKVVDLEPAAQLVTGLEHLEGLEVAVLADGYVHPRRTVIGGEIMLDRECSRVVIGLPYVPRVQPNRTEVPLEDGTAQGRVWKCNKVTVKVWKTQGGEYADGPESKFYNIPMREAQLEMSEQQMPVTGFYDAQLNSTHRDGLDITLRQTLPLPFHVTALIPSFDISGK
jgi:hypothetical protein